MKKFFLFFIATSAMASDLNTLQDARRGAFIGLEAGFGRGSAKIDDTQTTARGLIVPISSNTTTAAGNSTTVSKLKNIKFTGLIKEKFNSRGCVGGLTFGYNFRLPNSCAMVGFISNVNLMRLRGNLPYSLNIIDQTTTVTRLSTGATTSATVIDSSINPNTNVQMINKAAMNACARFGWWFGRVLPFIKVGFTLMRTTFRTPSRDYAYWFKATNRWSKGLVVGGGFDVITSTRSAIGFTFDCGLYSKQWYSLYNAHQYKPINRSFIKCHIRPITFSGMVSLKYLFPERKFGH